jgi:hypothetical protein
MRRQRKQRDRRRHDGGQCINVRQQDLWNLLLVATSVVEVFGFGGCEWTYHPIERRHGQSSVSSSIDVS